MSFIDAIKSVFSQYAGFSGRARRSEYWWFTLFNMIISGIIGAILVLGSTFISEMPEKERN